MGWLGLKVNHRNRLLIVEDDEDLSAELADAFSSIDRVCIRAKSAEEAIQLISNNDDIFIIILDIVLPRMSGSELAKRLQELRPRMRVLYMSGYTDDAIVHHGVLSAGAAFVQKPFTADALTRKVREILESG